MPPPSGRSRARLLADLAASTTTARPFPNPFGGGRTLYGWLRIWLVHDHEHAEDVRDALGGSPF